jgi:hypothetical protein
MVEHQNATYPEVMLCHEHDQIVTICHTRHGTLCLLDLEMSYL